MANNTGEEMKKLARQAAKAVKMVVAKSIMLKVMAIALPILIFIGIIAYLGFDFTQNEQVSVSGGVGDILRGTDENGLPTGARFVDGRIELDEDLNDRVLNLFRESGRRCWYLEDNPELLTMMIKAEIITSFPRTIYQEDEDIQGSVRIRRDGIHEEDFRYVTETRFEELLDIAQSNANFALIRNYYTVDANMNIVVAIYSRVTVTDGDGNIIPDQSEYIITRRTLEFTDHVINYAIPFEFLYALLLQTSNPSYVMALANLAINHTYIEFTILDSSSTHITVNEYWHDIYAKTTEPFRENVAPLINENALTNTGDSLTEIITRRVESNSIRPEITNVRTWIVERTATITHSEGDYISGDREYILYASPEDRTSIGGHPNDRTFIYEFIEEEPTIIYYQSEIHQGRNRRRYTTIITRQETRDVVQESRIDPSWFLGLWRNYYGEYDPNAETPAEFISMADGGRRVYYFASPPGWWSAPSTRIIGASHLPHDIERFFSRLRQTPRTQNHERLMRYVIYVYTGRDFGVTDPSDLLDIFNRRQGQFSRASGMQQIKNFIRHFEAGNSPPICTCCRNYYIVHNDGANNPTVGWGIDIYRRRSCCYI